MFRKNLLRTVAVVAILLASASSYAFRAFPTDEWRYDPDDVRANSFFMGFQGGYILSNWGDIADAFEGAGFTLADLSEPGYAGRLFIGCYFSKFFGVEFGWLHVSGADYKFETEMPPFKLHNTITANIIDLTLNSHLPLSNNFEFFCKIGIAYGAYKDAFAFESRTVTVKGRDQGNTALTFGMGLDYCWSRHVSLGLAWQFYRGNDEINSYIADTNFFSIGIAYITG